MRMPKMTKPNGMFYVNHKRFERRLSESELIAEITDTDQGIERLLGNNDAPVIFPTIIQGTFMIYTLPDGILVHNRRTELGTCDTWISNSLSIYGSETADEFIRHAEDIFKEKGYITDSHLKL
jgi:hypothetical protein